MADGAAVCPGLLEACLLDGEGVLVERWVGEGAAVDPEELAVEALAGFRAVESTAAAGRVGATGEWMLAGSAGALVIRPITGTSLLLVLCVGAGEWLGRARFAARLMAERVAAAL
jgi:predicted regulator of Ras-like GTPase activity (Roadblock/LC7/MglB family)